MTCADLHFLTPTPLFQGQRPHPECQRGVAGECGLRDSRAGAARLGTHRAARRQASRGSTLRHCGATRATSDLASVPGERQEERW